MLSPNAHYIEYANLLFAGIYATWLLTFAVYFFGLPFRLAISIFQLSPLLSNSSLALLLAPAVLLCIAAVRGRASGPHFWIGAAYLSVYAIYLLLPGGLTLQISDGSFSPRKPSLAILLFSALQAVPTIVFGSIVFRSWRA